MLQKWTTFQMSTEPILVVEQTVYNTGEVDENGYEIYISPSLRYFADGKVVKRSIKFGRRLNEQTEQYEYIGLGYTETIEIEGK